MNRKSDGKHVVFKQIPVDDLPKVERQSALNEVNITHTTHLYQQSYNNKHQLVIL